MGYMFLMLKFGENEFLVFQEWSTITCKYLQSCDPYMIHWYIMIKIKLYEYVQNLESNLFMLFVVYASQRFENHWK
jgi:hypothetical protein